MSLTEKPELPSAVLSDTVLATLAPAFPAGAVDELRGRVHGPVYVAGDDGLAAEVATWNVAVQHTPAVAVGATCAADVAAAVSWAVAHDLRVAVQATGHGPVRNAAGSLMVTTRRMQGVQIDPERRTARVEAGVKWARVLEAAAEFGLAGLCGSSSDVGVVGYTLGGGMGSLGRQYGFAADHVHAVEIVTADGRLRRLTADAEPELFWAVRGGKGNLGIVTALEIELVPVTGLYAGGIFFAGDDAPALLHRFRQWAPMLPEHISSSIALLRLPDLEFLPPPLRGQTVVHLRFASAGPDEAEAERLLAPMKEAGRIVLGYVGPIRTTEMDSIHMDPVDPMPAFEKGLLLTDLTEEAVDALLAAAGPQLDVPVIMVEIRLMGGALGRPAAVPNAVPGRSGAFAVYVIGPGVPELAQVVPAVVGGVVGALAPWRAAETMINFLGDVSGPGEVRAAYPPETLTRLRAVKAAVDPAGIFTFGHAI
ncbi:FAD-binding oxidoreductase [Blastococcus tunisiensis]|uniref:FAD/FMN-containing dehydrogenase n=1 Tax=Blastococcus tunisiensis TaxID=1798228 RepID=A0A1I2KJT6_9ACTN|nr:FAD-binding oxidoreductase [Blastococcus sp. DSM 46838]SFF65361.1 FAD/FMN-containing dehydrogenase [Blastococcus sp. DSM 46838]